MCMVDWLFFGTTYEPLQHFYRSICEYTFALDYERIARCFFNSSIDLWNLAGGNLASLRTNISSQKQKDSTINNNLLDTIICSGRFGFHGAPQHVFWMNNNSLFSWPRIHVIPSEQQKFSILEGKVKTNSSWN